jgi:hypothetical protein
MVCRDHRDAGGQLPKDPSETRGVDLPIAVRAHPVRFSCSRDDQQS